MKCKSLKSLVLDRTSGRFCGTLLLIGVAALHAAACSAPTSENEAKTKAEVQALDSDNSVDRNEVQRQAQSRPSNQPDESATIALDSEDRMLICRATIAAIMGRPIGIITANESQSDTIPTTYQRPDDGSVWRNMCRISGNRVIWASVRADGSRGRWRSHPLDSYVRFELSETSLTITETFGDGSESIATFPK